MRNCGAAQKIMKRRRVLMALRAVVISSASEKSLWQNLIVAGETTPRHRFPSAHTRRIPQGGRDPSAALGMTMPENPNH